MISSNIFVVVLLSFSIFAYSQSNSQQQESVNYVCTDCIKLVDAILSFMSDKPVQDKVVGLLDSELCGRLNYVFMKDCTDQVEGFIPYFMYYLQNKISRKQVCEVVNMCPYSPYSTPSTAVEPLKPVIQDTIRSMMGGDRAMPSAECQFCQLGEGEIAMLLENQQAKAIVEQELGTICTELPFNSVQCSDLLTLYVDQVFHELEGYLAQNGFCVEFELCPKAELLVE